MRHTAYDVQELDRMSAHTCARDSPAVHVDLFSVRPLLRSRELHEDAFLGLDLGLLLWRT